MVIGELACLSAPRFFQVSEAPERGVLNSRDLLVIAQIRIFDRPS